MDVAMATKVSVAPGIAPGSAQMSIESPPWTQDSYWIDVVRVETIFCQS